MGGVCNTQGDMRNAYKILNGKLKWRRPLVGDVHLDGRTLLKWALEEYCVKTWTGFTGVRKESTVGHV